MTLEVASKRSCIQTAGLAFQKDVDDFGLDMCFEQTMLEWKMLVEEGFFDEKTQTTLSVRIICSLGDNLEQNNIAGMSFLFSFVFWLKQTHTCIVILLQIVGMRLNFSTMEYSCRKCMCSRSTLKNATSYEEILSKNNEQRTSESLQANFLESKEIKRLHVNSVYKPSLYHQFPYFDTAKMLPQCSSHDFMEGKKILI